MKKFLLLGNQVAKYHSAKGVDERLKNLLGSQWEMVYQEDGSGLTVDNLSKMDMVISYLEFGAEPLTNSQAGALLSYVSQGGTFMVIHNGISLQNRSEIGQLVGAKFIGHPHYDTLPVISYKVADVTHPIMKGVEEEFEMGDEPYQFQMEDLAEKELFLEYFYEDKLWPAAWSRNFGLGRVVYFANGHNLEGFYNENFSKMIQNAVDWMMKGKE